MTQEPTPVFRATLQRAAFFLKDFQDQERARYVLFLPEHPLFGSNAFAVDEITERAGHFIAKRCGVPVVGFPFTTEFILVARELIGVMSREDFFRGTKVDELTTEALGRELNPEEAAIKDYQRARLHQTLRAKLGTGDSEDNGPKLNTGSVGASFGQYL